MACLTYSYYANLSDRIMDYQMEGSSGSPGPTTSMKAPRTCSSTADNSQARLLSLRVLPLIVIMISLAHAT